MSLQLFQSLTNTLEILFGECSNERHKAHLQSGCKNVGAIPSADFMHIWDNHQYNWHALTTALIALCHNTNKISSIWVPLHSNVFESSNPAALNKFTTRCFSCHKLILKHHDSRLNLTRRIFVMSNVKVLGINWYDKTAKTFSFPMYAHCATCEKIKI